MMNFDYSGKVVMITGGGGALGGAVVKGYHAAGATVVVVDRMDDDALTKRLGIGEDRVMLAGGSDLLDPAVVQNLVDRVVAAHERIDVLVNTIGGYQAGTPVHETALETWDFMMHLNARSIFSICQTVIPVMLKQGGGRIVNTAAGAGKQGSTNHSAYSASKAAVMRITESMAAEYKSEGITVNAILPTTIDTPANRESMPNANFDKWVKPANIAQVMMFLTSDAGTTITGGMIPVNN